MKLVLKVSTICHKEYSFWQLVVTCNPLRWLGGPAGTLALALDGGVAALRHAGVPVGLAVRPAHRPQRPAARTLAGLVLARPVVLEGEAGQGGHEEEQEGIVDTRHGAV